MYYTLIINIKITRNNIYLVYLKLKEEAEKYKFSEC